MMGILFLLFAPKAFNNDSMTMSVQAKTFAVNLQRAQLIATSRGISVSVCTVNTGYYFQAGTGCTNTPISDAGGELFSTTLRNGTTLGGSSLNNPWFFNSAGIPSTGAAYEIKPVTGTAITVSVTPITGLVSIN